MQEVITRSTHFRAFWMLFVALIGLTAAAFGGQESGALRTPGELMAAFERGEEPEDLYNYYERHAIRVKFDDGLQVRRRGNTVRDLARSGASPELTAFLFGLESLGIRAGQLRPARPPEVAEALIDQLYADARSRGADVSDLNNFYTLELGPELNAAAAMRVVRDLPGVEYALFMSRVHPSLQATPIIPDFAHPQSFRPDGANARQRHHDDAPSGGLGARSAGEGGQFATGAGVRAIIIEYNINSNHVDLTRFPGSNQPLLMLRWPAPNLPPAQADTHHGTSVAAILGARNNGFGVQGVAPDVELAFVSNWIYASGSWPNPGVHRSDIFGAINIAVANSQPGDVINISLGADGPLGQHVPVSWEKDVWEAINLAVSAGRTVVTGAGNQGANLDDPIYSSVAPGWPPGEGPFTPDNVRHVIVGGAVPIGRRINWPVSNGVVTSTEPSGPLQITTEALRFFNSSFGSAVRLHGWYIDMVTAGGGGIAQPTLDTTGNGVADTVAEQLCYPATRDFLPVSWPFIEDPDSEVCYQLRALNINNNRLYRRGWTGTSGAGPMVAGAFASLQSQWRVINGGQSATQGQLLALIEATGVPAAQGANIGVMPDLRAALRALADPAVLDPLPPVFDPPPGTYGESQNVRMFPASQSGSIQIRYTVDGSEPTLQNGWPSGTANVGVWAHQELTIKARAFRWEPNMQRWFEGPVATGHYVIDERTAAPQFVIYPDGQPGSAQPMTLNDTSVVGPAMVEGSSATPGATIYVLTPPLGGTLAGLHQSEEERDWPPVDGPILFEPKPGSYWLHAYATAPGRPQSAVTSIASFRVQPSSTLENPGPAPTIFPNGGVFHGSRSVNLFHGNLNATIRYTLDGTEPDENSTPYAGGLQIANPGTTVLRARAFAEGQAPSATSSANFVILGAPAPPGISPAAGQYTDAVTLTMSAGPNQIIRYTINGADPSTSSTLYNSPVILPPGQHLVKARAFNTAANTSSIVTSASYTVFDPSLVVQAPVIEPRAGNQTLIFTLKMHSNTEGAEIRWLLDDFDNDVGPDSWLYDPDNPPQLGSLPGGVDYFVKARAFKDGQPSQQSQMSYTVFWPYDGDGNPLEVAPVEVDPPGGLYHNPIGVVFRTTTPFSGFHFTIDDSEPYESPTSTFRPGSQGAGQPSQSNAISLSRSRTYSVIGVRTGYLPSDIAVHEYRFQAASPSASIEILPDNHQAVTLSSETNSATIRYTLDDSEPDETSPLASDPIELGFGEHFLNARAFRNFFEPSTVSSFLIEVRPPDSAPEILTQPVSATRGLDQSVTFTVTAIGNPAPEYQWYKNGVQVGYSSPSLFLDRLRIDSAGEYEVVVTNSAGSTTSVPATLTIISGDAMFQDRFEDLTEP